MAKLSSVEKNKRRARMAKRFGPKRIALKAIAKDRSKSMEERFEARLKLAKLPRNSNINRVRNRCELTGRARGVYSRFKLGRTKLRELAATGQLPGVVKSSW